MAKTIGRRSARGASGRSGDAKANRLQESRQEKAGQATRRRATNLTLDPAAVARGEAFRVRHGLGSLSQLVNAMLVALPSGGPGEPAHTTLAPAVRRLLGVAGPQAGAGTPAKASEAGVAEDPRDDPRTAYRAHLVEKYVNTHGGAA